MEAVCPTKREIWSDIIHPYFFVTSSSRRVAGIGNLIVGWILAVIYSTMANATDSYFVHEIIWQI